MIESNRLILIPMVTQEYQQLSEGNRIRVKGNHIPDYFYKGENRSIIINQLSLLAMGCPESMLTWWVILKEDVKVIGDVGFNGIMQEGVIEIYYQIDSNYQDNGYATEAITALTFWIFLTSKVKEVVAKVNSQNQKSIAVMEKVGYKLEAVINKDLHFVFKFNQLSQRYAHFFYNNTIVVSSCLLGLNTKYSGGDNKSEKALALMEKYNLVPFCPEQSGGLATPRPPSEIIGHSVIANSGENLTNAFNKGSDELIKLAHIYQARAFMMKGKSPSCGIFEIYDGSFSGKLMPGSGLAVEKIKTSLETCLILDEISNLFIKFRH